MRGCISKILMLYELWILTIHGIGICEIVDFLREIGTFMPRVFKILSEVEIWYTSSVCSVVSVHHREFTLVLC